MRNPVGPLPSSIYWRRRAVAASLIALLALLIVWALTSLGGGGGSGDPKAGGPNPAPSITPGPSGSGPAISRPPGGRDESGSGGGAGSDGSNGDGEPGGADGGPEGGADTAGSGGADGGPGSAPDGVQGSGTGSAPGAERVPAGSPLPDCGPAALRLSLRTDVSYGPNDKPVFRLVVTNTSATTCKADFGPKTAVLTITEAGGEDDRIWSSADCPAASGPLYLKVPAGATVVHTVTWDRRKSSPACASAPTKDAGPGTYLLEAKAPGAPLQRASFVLPKE
ncbi:hypothetical protein [Streptomyces fulvorobeus]|nr:hypothetical protein [Streptomyces fulvorobeus]GFM97839.1 hypothetical protein Sfulv_26500 [Streptomyces fulvorobeus]